MARGVIKRPCEESLIWFTFIAHRRRWTVWLVPLETLLKYWGPVGENERPTGICYWRDAMILVRASLSLRELQLTVLHEVSHACHGDPRDEKYHSAHERSVRRMEKPLFRVLTKECALRFPPLPHDLRYLRRKQARHAK